MRLGFVRIYPSELISLLTLLSNLSWNLPLFTHVSLGFQSFYGSLITTSAYLLAVRSQTMDIIVIVFVIASRTFENSNHSIFHRPFSFSPPPPAPRPPPSSPLSLAFFSSLPFPITIEQQIRTRGVDRFERNPRIRRACSSSRQPGSVGSGRKKRRMVARYHGIITEHPSPD